jgi:photosystem II stability/assembly factor-like uncharacterized protein
MQFYAGLADRLCTLSTQGNTGQVGSADWQVERALVGFSLECVAASPEMPERVFVGTVDSGLQRSADGGTSWEQVATFGDRVTAVTVSPHDPSHVWAGTEPSGVYRSTDGGDSWTHCEGLTALPSASRWSFPPRPHTHHVRWLELDPTRPQTVYVAIEAGAFVRSTDAGETWIDHPTGALRDNHTLATHPNDTGRVYAAAGDGYAESADFGETWDHRETGLDHRYVWSVAVDAADPDSILVSAARGARTAHRAGSAESYVYRRTPGGWEQAMDGLPEPEGLFRPVLASGSRNGEFAALTNAGLFWSEDAGRHWDRIPVDASWDQIGRGLVLFQPPTSE